MNSIPNNGKCHKAYYGKEVERPSEFLHLLDSCLNIWLRVPGEHILGIRLQGTESAVTSQIKKKHNPYRRTQQYSVTGAKEH